MTDLDFVRGCCGNNKQAWDEFLSRYNKLIYKYIHNVLNSKGFASRQDLIDDIYQELFSSLIENDYRKLRSFKAKNNCSLASWLRQVTINLTLDHLRRIKPDISLEAENEAGSSLKDLLVDNSFSIPELLNYEETLDTLETCIDKLSQQEQYIIELNINQGIKLEVLREFLKISRGAIDMQKSRIMDKLKECFKSKGFKLDF